MKKLINLSIILLLLFGFYNESAAQTDLENQRRYWAYRQRLKTDYMKIGINDGESLTASEYRNDATQQKITWGDCMFQHGYYLAVLATEYKLLKDAGKDITPTLNELYYAIKAVRRLDEQAEFYFSKHAQNSDFNGFFMRDDIPPRFYQEWYEDGIREVSGDHAKTIDSSLSILNPNLNNEMSQDQLYSLLMGFRFVVEYVDNVSVQPTTSDPAINILDEVRLITDKLMLWVQTEHNQQTIVSPTCAFGGSFTLNKKKTWTVYNPVEEEWVTRGKDMFPLLFPAAFIGKAITGNDYDQIDWYHRRHHANSTCFPQDFTYRGQFYKSGILLSAEGKWEAIGRLYNNINTYIVVEDSLGQVYDTITVAPGGEVNKHMVLQLAATSNVGWTREQIWNLATINDMKIFDLVYCALHDSTPNWSRQDIISILGQANCQNPHRDDTLYNWRHSNRWAHPSRSWHEEVTANYSGLDYMLLYNLYHILYSEDITSEYKGEIGGCPCQSSILQSVSQLNSTFTKNLKFPEYEEMGINGGEFLTHSVDVTNNGVLYAKFNLNVCQSNIDCYQGGEVIIGNTNGDGSVTRIMAGSKLIIGGSGSSISSLLVNNNAKLIIEEGATLEIKPNSEIILDGPEATIEIKGKLDIRDGHTFAFNGGTNGTGYMIFSSETNSSNVTGTPNSSGQKPKFILSGNNSNDKKLEIKNKGLIVGEEIDLFSMDNLKVYMGPSSRITIKCPSNLQSIDVVSIISGQKHLGIHLLGYSSEILFLDIKDGFYGIKADNYIGGNSSTINACTFTDCFYGVWAQDKGLKLNSCSFIWCDYAVKTIGMSYSSSFKDMNATYSIEKVIDYAGGRTSGLNLQKPYYVANTNGVRFKAGVLTSRCGLIDGTATGAQYGIKADLFSTVDLSQNLNKNSGLNQVTNNWFGLDLNSSALHLKDGYNNFESDNYTVYGNANGRGAGGNVVADYNFWTYGTPQGPLNQITTVSYPIGYTPNYSLGETFITTGGGTVFNAVNISDPSYLVAPPNYSTLCAQCCQNVTLDGYRPVTDIVINTTDFNNVPMSFAIEAAIDSIYPDSTADYVVAIDLFYQILTYTYPTSLDDDQEELLELAYDKMAEAIGNAYLYGQITNPPTGINENVQKLLDVQLVLASRYDVPGDNFRDRMRKAKYNLDNATTYRLIDDRTTARSILSSMLSWETNPDVIEEINIWDCIINREQLVLDSIIDLDSLENMPLCEPEQVGGGTAMPIFASTPFNKENSTQFIKVYPNPFKESTTIEYILTASNEVNISITDINGKEVYNHKEKEDVGKHQLIFNSESLPQGIYFCKINTGNYSKTVKLILLK